MGIAKVNNQKALPDGGPIPRTPGCGCNSGGNPFFTVDSYVPLNLQTYEQYLKAVMPQPKPMPRRTPTRWKMPSWTIPTVRGHKYY